MVSTGSNVCDIFLRSCCRRSHEEVSFGSEFRVVHRLRSHNIALMLPTRLSAIKLRVHLRKRPRYHVQGCTSKECRIDEQDTARAVVGSIFEE